MMRGNIELTRDLLAFIEKSPTAFHAVDTVAKILEENGFVKLSENETWNIHNGGRYYVTRNLSSIIAFTFV